MKWGVPIQLWKTEATVEDEESSRVANLRYSLVAIMAVAVGVFIVTLFVTGFELRPDPVAIFAIAMLPFLGFIYFMANRWSASTSGTVLAVVVYVFIFAYIFTRWANGIPLAGHAYIVLPAILALVYSRFLGASIAIMVGAAWTIFASLTGLVSTSLDSAVSIGATMSLLLIVAYLLEHQRRKVTANIHHWQRAYNTLNSVLTSSHDAIYGLSPEGIPLISNEPAKKWQKVVTGSDGTQTRVWEPLPGGIRSEFEVGFKKAVEGSTEMFRFHFPFNGVDREWESCFHPKMDRDGAILVIRDVSEEFLQKIRRVAEREEVRQNTLNLLTHDINTPLTPILLAAHEAKLKFESRGDSALSHKMEIIERNAKRAIDMVDHLIEQSKQARLTDLAKDGK